VDLYLYLLYGPVVEQLICIIRTTQESVELYKDLDRIADMKNKDWNGQDV
jgi:hypothetical protein